MASQEINVKANVGNSAAKVDELAASLDGVGKSAEDAQESLADVAKVLNEFLAARGKMTNQTPRLFDAARDIAEIQQLNKAFQETISLSPKLRAMLNSSGFGSGSRPANPAQVQFQNAKQQEHFLNHALARTFHHDALSSARPINTGLTYDALTGRSSSANPSPADASPSSPGGAAQAAKYIAQHAVNGAGGAAQAAGNGLLGGLAGKLPGGLLGGALLGGAGYLAFKGVSKAVGAVDEGIDQNKVEAVEVDKFRRSIGAMAGSFDNLRNQTRRIGDEFHMTYEQSRKLTVGFAEIARVHSVDQAGEGVGLARAVGVDEAQGSSFMAAMRLDQSIGEKKSDARLLAIQFADALKRTGSTLNAKDLMQSIEGFSSATASRSLTSPNVEGFAGILSAMVGTNRPGMTVQNAANIMNQADSAFRAGGQMGEASDTLQFMALDGAKTGLLGYQMRKNAGLFATGNQALNDPEVNKMLGRSDSAGQHGDKTALASIIEKMSKSGVDRETQLLSFTNSYMKGNPAAAAALWNLHGEKKLDKTLNLAKEYGVDVQGVSGFGIRAMSDIGAENDVGGLQKVRKKMLGQEGLTAVQKDALKGAESITDQKQLTAALMGVAKTLNRETTEGQKIEQHTADMATAINRMADGLLPAAILGNKLLENLVVALAPDSDSAKRLRLETDSDYIKERKKVYDAARSTVREMPDGPAKTSQLQAIDENEFSELGTSKGFRSGMVGDPRLNRGFAPGGAPPTRGPAASASTQSGVLDTDAKQAIIDGANSAGIKPEFLLGLAQHETGMGKKSIKGGGKDTKNLFNIKDFSKKGSGIRAFDETEKSNDRYRAYDSYEDSVADIASQLKKNYPDAAKATTAEEFTAGLKKGRLGAYATDPNHSKNVTTAIKQQAVKLPTSARTGAAPTGVGRGVVNGAVSINLLYPGGETQEVSAPLSGVYRPQGQGAVAWA